MLLVSLHQEILSGREGQASVETVLDCMESSRTSSLPSSAGKQVGYTEGERNPSKDDRQKVGTARLDSFSPCENIRSTVGPQYKPFQSLSTLFHLPSRLLNLKTVSSSFT